MSKENTATKPNVTSVSGGAALIPIPDDIIPTTSWISGINYGAAMPEYLTAAIQGGNEYLMYAVYAEAFMHYFDSQTKRQILVNGKQAEGELLQIPISGSTERLSLHIFTFKIKADHNWGKGTVITKADCLNEGSESFSCQNCDAEKTEVIPATGHDWGEGTVVTEATPTAEGSKNRIRRRRQTVILMPEDPPMSPHNRQIRL